MQTGIDKCISTQIPHSSILHTDAENYAMECIVTAMEAICNMDDRGRMQYNIAELCAAIHVLQSFVKQHVLWRLDSDFYSDWWQGDGHDKK